MYAGTDLLTITFTKTYLQKRSGAGAQPARVAMAAVRRCSVIFLFRGIGDYLANYFPFWVGRQVIKAIRAELFAHYLRLPTATLRSRVHRRTMLRG